MVANGLPHEADGCPVTDGFPAATAAVETARTRPAELIASSVRRSTRHLLQLPPACAATRCYDVPGRPVFQLQPTDRYLSPTIGRWRWSMTASVGDRIVVESQKVGTAAREGEILEVLETAVGINYRVRWDDGHETEFRPAAGVARIIPARTPEPAARK